MIDSTAGTPTLETVAAHAGVSRATASRVINGSPRVSEKVVQAVNASIAALNYVPNRAARSLASRRTQAIALVVPESTTRVFADPFFASLVEGVAIGLAPTDYTLTLLMETEATAEKTRRYLLGGNVDGALIASHHRGDHSYEHLSATLPVVFGGRPLHADSDSPSYAVDVDNAHGAESAVDLLATIGRTRIATIAGPQDMAAGVDRLRGFEAALHRHGLTSAGVEVGDFSPGSGTDAMARLLKAGTPIDAVFAANDQMAQGAYVALARAGLRIPDDVAIVGFDDDPNAALTSPPLTTIRQPSVEIGTRMASTLVDLIEGRAAPAETLLKTQLVRRDSA